MITTNPIIPDTYTICATEGGTCPANVPTIVGYTATNDTTDIYFRDTNTPVNCSTSIFNDPAPYVVKKCLKLQFPDSMMKLSYDPASGLPVESLGFKLCSDEGTICDPSKLDPSVGDNPVDIMFGAKGIYEYAQIIGPVSCSTTVFGDPAPHETKKCLWRLSQVSPPSQPPSQPPSPSPGPGPGPGPGPQQPIPSPGIPPKSKTGLIIGLTVGFIFLIIIIVVIIFMMKKKSKKK